MNSIADEIDRLRLKDLLRDPQEVVRVCARGFEFVERFIVEYGDALETQIPGFRRHFVVPLKSVKSVEFIVLNNGSAFQFDFATGSLRINIGHILGLLAIAHDKLQLMRLTSDPADMLDPSEDAKLLRLILCLFVLHEVRHISQGLGRYEDVQRIKQRFGPLLIGDFDILADRDAARAYAFMNIVNDDELSIDAYLHTFAHALFFMAEYCFPAFKVPTDKPHKVARALGLVLMLARLSVSIKRDSLLKDHSGKLPLDAALIVRIADDWSKLTIMAYAPELQVLALEAPVDPEQLKTLCARLDSGDADDLVLHGVSLLKQLRLI